MFNEIYLILIVFLFTVIFIGGIMMRSIKNNRLVRYLDKFTQYRSVLEYHMDKAYEMIHKEHILTYSLDAFRIDEKDYDKISKEFVKLVSKFIGPLLLKEYINIYGDIDTYTFNILDYFSTRYENDEIRNTALEQITETEIDE